MPYTRGNPGALAPEVLQVLQTTSTGKGTWRHYLTSLQILHRLDPALRAQVIAGEGAPGAGARQYVTAAHFVAKACEVLVKQGLVDHDFADVNGATYAVGGQTITPGYPIASIFRIKQGGRYDGDPSNDRE